jgi:hypothetical protein
VNGFDWAIVFPVLLKWGVIIVCGVVLWGMWWIANKSDDECLKMGYKRNRR